MMCLELHSSHVIEKCSTKTAPVPFKVHVVNPLTPKSGQYVFLLRILIHCLVDRGYCLDITPNSHEPTKKCIVISYEN